MEDSIKLYNYAIKDKKGRLFCVIQAVDAETALERAHMVEELVQATLKEPVAEHYKCNTFSVPWFGDAFFINLTQRN